MKNASSQSSMTLNFFPQILNYMPFDNIFEQLMKMSELNQQLMLLSEEEILLKKNSKVWNFLFLQC